MNGLDVRKGVVFPEEIFRKEKETDYLLYPGPDALDASEAVLSADCRVIVLDGTWSQARKLYHSNPVLKTLPKISFDSSMRSTFRIRRQPAEHCLSTLESMAHLLKINFRSSRPGQDMPDYDILLKAFDRLNEIQLKYYDKDDQRGMTS